MLRHVVLGAVSAIALTASAHAADMYVPGPAGGLKDTYVPGIEWTGFYLGAGGGAGATSQDLKAIFNTTTLAEANGIGGMGGFGTLQVGYDRVIMPRIVIGAFFDYDFDSIDSNVSFFNGAANFHFNLNDMWTAGGRLGYLINPNTMVYALGGYSQATFDLPAGTHNSTFSGYSVGAGLETNITGNWFLKGEYRYTSLDDQTIFAHRICPDSCTGTFKVTDQPDIQTGRLVLSYKFNPFGYEPLK